MQRSSLSSSSPCCERTRATSAVLRLEHLDAIRLGGPEAWNQLRAAGGDDLISMLGSACFCGQCLDGIDFGGMLLPDAELDYCGLDRANLREAQLIGASVRCAHVRAACAERVVFVDSDLSNTDFSGSILRGADLTGAELYNTRWDAADLRMALLDRASIGGATFDSADLRSASFRGAQIWHVDLRTCQLDGAHFEGATISDAILPASARKCLDLRGVTLRKITYAEV